MKKTPKMVPNSSLKKDAVNKIVIHRDYNCDMAEVIINRETDYLGNEWDYHPGCHGEYHLGDFKGSDGYVNACVIYYTKFGYKFADVVVKEGTWDYGKWKKLKKVS